jgi:hypothetical protein
MTPIFSNNSRNRKGLFAAPFNRAAKRLAFRGIAPTDEGGETLSLRYTFRLVYSSHFADAHEWRALRSFRLLLLAVGYGHFSGWDY